MERKSGSFVYEQFFKVKPLKEGFSEVKNVKGRNILQCYGLLNVVGDRWSEQATAWCLSNPVRSNH